MPRKELAAECLILLQTGNIDMGTSEDYGWSVINPVDQNHWIMELYLTKTCLYGSSLSEANAEKVRGGGR